MPQNKLVSLVHRRGPVRGGYLSGDWGHEMSECVGLWGRLFGHKMTEYSVKVAPPRMESLPFGEGEQSVKAIVKVINKLTHREFRIVCVRCGMEGK